MSLLASPRGSLQVSLVGNLQCRPRMLLKRSLHACLRVCLRVVLASRQLCIRPRGLHTVLRQLLRGPQRLRRVRVLRHNLLGRPPRLPVVSLQRHLALSQVDNQQVTLADSLVLNLLAVGQRGGQR